MWRPIILVAVGRCSLSGIDVDRHRGRAGIACQKFRHSCSDRFTLGSQHQTKRNLDRPCLGPCTHPIGFGNEPQAFRFQKITHSRPGKSLGKPLSGQPGHILAASVWERPSRASRESAWRSLALMRAGRAGSATMFDMGAECRWCRPTHMHHAAQALHLLHAPKILTIRKSISGNFEKKWWKHRAGMRRVCSTGA